MAIAGLSRSGGANAREPGRLGKLALPGSRGGRVPARSVLTCGYAGLSPHSSQLPSHRAPRPGGPEPILCTPNTH